MILPRLAPLTADDVRNNNKVAPDDVRKLTTTEPATTPVAQPAPVPPQRVASVAPGGDFDMGPEPGEGTAQLHAIRANRADDTAHHVTGATARLHAIRARRVGDPEVKVQADPMTLRDMRELAQLRADFMQDTSGCSEPPCVYCTNHSQDPADLYGDVVHAPVSHWSRQCASRRCKACDRHGQTQNEAHEASVPCWWCAQSGHDIYECDKWQAQLSVYAAVHTAESQESRQARRQAVWDQYTHEAQA